MTRLIDADELKMSVILPRCGAKTTIGDAICKMIDSALTIDAEPVIRCKDCNWFRERNGETQCVLWNYETTSKNAFCFYGSRKQTGADYAGFEVYEAERPE